MADAEDLDGLFVDFAEQDAVVADPQAELGAWRLELDAVACAGFEITIDRLKNLPGGFAVDGAQVGAGRRRPDHKPFGHRSGAPFRTCQPGRTRAGSPHAESL